MFHMRDKIRLSVAAPYRLLFAEEFLVDDTVDLDRLHSYSVTCVSQRARTFAIKVENFMHLLKMCNAKESLNMKVISMKTEMRGIEQNENRRLLSSQVCDIKALPNGRIVMATLAKPIDEEVKKDVIKEIYEQNFLPKKEEMRNLRHNSQPRIQERKKPGDGLTNE